MITRILSGMLTTFILCAAAVAAVVSTNPQFAISLDAVGIERAHEQELTGLDPRRKVMFTVNADDPSVVLEGGNALITVRFTSPDLQERLNEFLQPTAKYQLAKFGPFRIYLRGGSSVVLRGEGPAISARAKIKLRWKTDYGRKKHDHHLTIDVPGRLHEGGVLLKPRMRNKKGFSGEIEQRINKNFAKNDALFALPEDVSALGVELVELQYEGTSMDGSFAATATLRAPISAIPFLLSIDPTG